MEGELALSLGKAVDFALHGVSGIVNVMPFACMPGIVVAGLAPRFRADLGGIPWLDLSFDAQGGTNTQTRLEAFIYQARHYRQQKRATTGGAHRD
jgi:predicted nucleotide-binding protein (sugar kinase/HSP70/actin superfamily)